MFRLRCLDGYTYCLIKLNRLQKLIPCKNERVLSFFTHCLPQSEEFLGDFLAETGTSEPKDVQIATKFAPLP